MCSCESSQCQLIGSRVYGDVPPPTPLPGLGCGMVSSLWEDGQLVAKDEQDSKTWSPDASFGDPIDTRAGFERS